MVVLGFDTATPATVVGLRSGEGEVLERRDDPRAGGRPQHASHLLAFCWELLEEARLDWSDVEAIAVGIGPGAFTGLRIGLATARGLAQSLGVQLTGVSSLQAIAYETFAAGDAGQCAETHQARTHAQRKRVLSVLDARRGEAFLAAYQRPSAGEPPSEILAPIAVKPEELARVVQEPIAGGRPLLAVGDEAPLLAVGDGAVLFAPALEAAGVEVVDPASPLARLHAGAICALSLLLPAAGDVSEVEPLYCRRPDAEIALRGAAR